MEWEADVLFWIHDVLSCGFMDALMAFVSNLCTGNLIWFLLVAILTYRKDTRYIGITLALALVISIVLCNGILKPCIDRTRPYVEYGIQIIVHDADGHSFPSGHTTGVTVVTTTLLIHLRKWGYVMIPFAATVMLSRMYLFMHYPTDIIGGIVVGTASVILAYVIMTHMCRRRGIPYHGIQRIEDEEGT